MNSLAFVLAVLGQADRDMDRVKAWMTGKVQVYYRTGGILYGTHHLVDIDHGAGGRYTLSVETKRKTIMDNIQPGGWRESGTWAVVREGRQLGIRYKTDRGGTGFRPVEVGADGEVRVLKEGFSRDTERFSMTKGWKLKFDVDLRAKTFSLVPR